jgi:hypothetical protein
VDKEGTRLDLRANSVDNSVDTVDRFILDVYVTASIAIEKFYSKNDWTSRYKPIIMGLQKAVKL